MRKLLLELNRAKKSKISSWIDEVSRKIDLLNEFFTLAESLGLVKDGKYTSGIPKGISQDVTKFYLLEDKLDYPKPQIII